MLPLAPPPPPWNLNHPLVLAALIGALNGVLLVAQAQGRFGTTILLPYVPLLLLGGLAFARGFQAAMVAAGVALGIIAAVSPAHAVFYVISEAAPALITLRLALTYVATRVTRASPMKPTEPERIAISPAFGAGWLFAALALYAALLLLCVAIWQQLAPSTPTGVVSTLIAQLKPLLPQLQPGPDATDATLDAIARHADLFMGGMVWTWILCLYGALALGRYLASGISPVAPRTLALQPFTLPLPYLGLLGLVGVVALAMGGDAGLWARVAVVALLLPYFLSGLTLSMARIPEGPHRRIWAFGIAALLVLFLPSIAIFIAIGLFYPLKGRSLS